MNYGYQYFFEYFIIYSTYNTAFIISVFLTHDFNDLVLYYFLYFRKGSHSQKWLFYKSMRLCWLIEIFTSWFFFFCKLYQMVILIKGAWVQYTKNTA